MKFETANALSSGVGLAKILFTDIDYVEIQESPRVILAQPENSFDLQTYLEFTSTFRHSANYWYNYEISTPTTRAWKWWKFVIVAAADAIGATGGVATAISASAASITLVDKAL